MNAFLPADILMPKTDHMEKWAVIACDQFTSDQAYWDRVRKNAEGAVSTINLILPEAELGTEKEAEHTAEINATMKKYMEDGVFTVYPNSFVYVERSNRGIVYAFRHTKYQLAAFSIGGNVVQHDHAAVLLGFSK